MWTAAAINTHWILYFGEEYPGRSALRVGYFVWLGCFVALALSVHAARRAVRAETVARAA